MEVIFLSVSKGQPFAIISSFFYLFLYVYIYKYIYLEIQMASQTGLASFIFYHVSHRDKIHQFIVNRNLQRIPPVQCVQGTPVTEMLEEISS